MDLRYSKSSARVPLVVLALFTIVPLLAEAQGETLRQSNTNVAFQSAAIEPRQHTDINVLIQYRDQGGNRAFIQNLKTLVPARGGTIQRVVGSLQFIDYGHSAPELLQTFLGEKRIEDLRYPYLYDKASVPAYAGYVSGRRYLNNVNGQLSLEKIIQLHAASIRRNLEGDAQAAGLIRSRFVYGPEFTTGLTRDQIDAVNESPYLHYMPATGIVADVPQGVETAVQSGRVRGAIVYPRPRDLKPEALERVRRVRPDVAQRVEEYQRQHGKTYSNHDEVLTRDLVAALLFERIQTFENESFALAKLPESERVLRYVRLIADFQKDYVSIHPFPDGNGRTSRLLLNHLAARENLPSPRLVYPNEDLFWTREMWAKQISDGMIANALLERDLIERIRNRQPLEDSVFLLTPLVPREAANRDTAVLYSRYIREQLSGNTGVRESYLRDAVGTMRDLLTKFESVRKTGHKNHP